MIEVKSWKQERLRRKRKLDSKQVLGLIIKDLYESAKQHLRDITSGQSAQYIAEITEKINNSKEQPVVVSVDCSEYYKPTKEIK